MKFLKYSIATLLFFAAFHSPAQEAIGTNNPNPQAALHIASPNKGLLIPKLALSNAATFIGPGTDAQSDTGMLVFNTNTDTNGTGLNGSGFYYWSTNSWEKLSGLTELNDKTTHVPLWVSNTNGGTYATHDVVSWSGVLYKNRTGTNTDSSPNADATNWRRVDQDLGNIVSVGRGILIRPNWPSVGWNLRVDENGADTFYTSNPSYRIIEELGGTNGGSLLIKGTASGTAGEPRLSVPEVVHATFSPDSNLRLGGDLNTDSFSTAWQSDTDGGSYLTNAIVIYNGVFYKNRTGTNTDTAPDADITNWTTTGANNVMVKVGRTVNGDITIATDSNLVSWANAFTSESLDTHNAFDIGSCRFTAPMDGWYEVYTSFRLNTGFSAGDIFWTRNSTDDFGNPSETIYSGPDGNADPRSKVIIGLIYLDANDTLDLVNRFGTTTTLGVGAGSNAVIKRIAQ